MGINGFSKNVQSITVDSTNKVNNHGYFEVAFGTAYTGMAACLFYFHYNQSLGYDGPNDEPATPEYLGNVQYTLPKIRFTMGLTMAYQQIKDEPARNSFNANLGFETVSRTSISTRCLYEIGKRSKILNFYLGIRAGINFWHDALPPGYYTNIAYMSPYPNLESFCGQFLLGLKLYPIKFAGIFVEVGIGSPYIACAGVTFSI